MVFLAKQQSVLNMKNNVVKSHLILLAGFISVFFVSMLFINNQYYQLMMNLVLIWSVMGISWNIICGYTGLASFGHAAFFGIGAYTVALGLLNWGITPWVGIILGSIIGSIMAFLIGWPTFRLKGQYFSLAMLAYPLAILHVFEWLRYQEVALPMIRDNPLAYMQFEDNRVYTALGLVFFAIAMIVAIKIETSRFGLSLQAIKQNEIAARTAGVNVLYWKLKAITISGALAGMIGGFYSTIILIVTPQSAFGMMTSAQALIVTLFGGIGSAWGPVIGSAILIPLSETLHAEFGEYLPGISGIVFGLAIILIILVAPEGIYWKVYDYFHKKSKFDKPLRNSSEEFSPKYINQKIDEYGTSPIILDVINLTKRFGGLAAVQGLNFSIPKGTIVGVIGPNGAGKTTLFNLFNMIYKPDLGSIKFDGQELVGMPTHNITRLGIGRTFQVVRVFNRMTAVKNVVVGAFCVTDDDIEAEKMARDAIEVVGLKHLSDEVVSTFSSLELRLLEIARAIASKPKLILLDETLAGLGMNETEQVLQVIAKLRDNGITIVIIEHTMKAMLRLVDRFIVLDHGVVLLEGRPDEVINDPRMIEAYLGQKWSKSRAQN